MELETPLDTICRLIVRAREWDAQVPADEADDVADEQTMSTDDPYDVMIDEKNESVEEEIIALLDDLAEDQLAEVLALAWIGSGTFDAGEWEEALEEAGDKESDPAADQLMEMPMLAAYLESGLESFGLSCSGVGQID
jgi:hypothetical protein